MIKTINLDGTEQAVKFAGKHTHFHVHSLGGEVLVSLAPNVERGADGVLIVQSGGAGYVQNDIASDTVYLVGAGEVQIVGSGNAFSPFKVGAEGGGELTTEGGTVKGTVDYPIIALNLYGNSTQDGTPTPEAPIDIVSVGDDGAVEVTSCGKNLLDVVQSCEVSTPQFVFNNAAITLLEKETYTFSFDSSLYIDTPAVALTFRDVNGSVAESKTFHPVKEGINSYTFTCEKSVATATLYANVTSTVVFSNIQIEKGSTVTSYESYKGSTATITSGLPLCSVGGVRDELVYNADGTGKIIKRTAKIVLDGSNDEAWQYSDGNAPFQLRLENGDMFEGQTELPKMYCNKYQPVPQGSMWGGYDYMVSTDVNGTLLAIRDISVTTLEAFKAKLNAVPMVVIYALATPQEIKLSASEMASLMTLQTFDGTTNISNDKSAKMKVKYCTNPLLAEYVKPVIDGAAARFEARIAALEAAVTNT